ncbi:MAG TPA: ABC transporter permease [Gaiellaceae bacterium]|nr:ABC transporter permease [Gaiellaceae bacterium]
MAEPQRDVGATYGTAATEYAADRAVGTSVEGAPEDTAGRSQLNLAFHRFIHHRMALAGLTIFVLLVAIAFIVPHFWKWGYAEITPSFASGPSLEHPMGTDTIGHDLFAQVMQATQTSLKSAFIVTVLATVVGTVIGAIAGYYGKLADATLMRFTDLVLTVPLLALLLVLANVLSKQSSNYIYIAIIIAAVLWTYLARLVRGTFLSLREHDYVIAARAIGARDRRIIFRHMVPNAMGPIVVNATLTVANAILIESALSFLGLGIQPPAVSLGNLIANGQGSATTEWWLFAFPSAVLVLIILAVNFVGDGLRDALDPRQTRVRA